MPDDVMPERVPACPKCNAKMELGELRDDGPLKWIMPGESHGWFRDILRGPFTVTAYRCPSCGYLESYAPVPEPAAAPGSAARASAAPGSAAPLLWAILAFIIFAALFALPYTLSLR